MTDLIKTKFKYILEKAQKYNSIREKNSDKYKTLNIKEVSYARWKRIIRRNNIS